MQTLRKKTSPCKYRNDPGRFFGDGVQFKAKLIGILEVGEARGDRMCQEALQDLKMAIRAAGEHKQRITIHVTIEGLRLRDEKSGDSLYHHPVHKISFIAQDMTDSRAFGYIFGSPDSGHRFFGIKTDKAASQVVLAMRDLFQVVFELKKKEIELARQQIQSKTIHDHLIASLSTVKSSGGGAAGGYGSSSASGGASSSLGGGGGGGSGAHGESGGAAGHGGHGLGASGGSSALHGASGMSRLGVNLDGKSGSSSGKEMSPESVADLVDLEQELSSIQRGITQMERITPGDVGQQHLSGSLGGGGSGMGGKSLDSEDPFGDSFTNFPTYNLLPPPESDRSRNKPNKTPDPVVSTGSVGATTSLGGILSPAALNRGSPGAAGQPDDDSWLHEIETPGPAAVSGATTTSASLDVFETSARKVGLVGLVTTTPMAPLAASESLSTPTQQLSENSVLSGAGASDLDVSGTAAAAPTATVAPSSTAAALTEALASGGGGGVAAEDPGKMVISDAFTDLDPLGTGRTRPYVDKKYFFQELKNPPKKVLKELSSSSSGGGGGGGGSLSDPSVAAGAALVDEFLSKEGLFDDACSVATDMMQHATKQPQQQQQQLHQQQQQQQQNTSLSSSIVSSVSQATTNQQQQQAPPSLPPPPQQQQQHHQMHQMPSATNITNVVSCNNTINNSDSLHSTQSPSGGGGAAGDSDDPVMLPRDTDPFSPTRKKSDPFHEGDIFSKLDPFDFEFGASGTATATKEAATPAAPSAIRLSPLQQQQKHSAGDVFSRPLQVSLPPEMGAAAAAAGGAAAPPHAAKQQPHWMADISHLERPPLGMDPLPPLAPSGGVRSRPSPSTAQYGATSSAALKQQTVDVISSISSKKMPHLFGQTRFSKRGGDSNTINMRRLQESDSLSETETAPEPPPRPDSGLHAEPPPLPPKKHFQETAVMCPRLSSGSGSAATNGLRSAPVAAGQQAAAAAVPPIPLPSRRIGRSDGTYPGPGRPRKPGHTEDDYLAPIQAASGGAVSQSQSADIPPLLPPPTQVSSRGRAQRQQSLQGAAVPPKAAQDIYENKTEILQHQMQQQQHHQQHHHEDTPAVAILPDITLSQLLTLGIDELAAKLQVPTSKLSTMTLVELTSYLAEFLEKGKPPVPPPVSSASPAGLRRRQPSPAHVATSAADPSASSGVFKVNFDQQATFVAKFDDTFGEDTGHAAAVASQSAAASEFVANFAQFNEPPVAPPTLSSVGASHTPAVPPADRYAVFREIIDLELQHQQQNADLIGDIISDGEEARPAAIEPERAASRGDDLVAGLEGLEMGRGTQFEAHFEDDTFSGHAAGQAPPPPPASLKIDTKITEVVAQAKDRYAALRDIILVENLFDNKPTKGVEQQQQQQQQHHQLGQESDKELMQGFPEFGEDFNEDQDIKQIMNNRPGSLGADRMGLVDSRGFPVEPSSSALTVEDDDDDDDDEEEEDGAGESSLDSNEKEAAGAVRRSDTDRYEKLSTSNQQLDQDKSEKGSGKQDGKFLTVAGGAAVSGGISSSLSASKDDLEIDELMQRAISNLSLDSRDRISPANSASVSVARPATASISSQLPMPGGHHQSQYNDAGTSPIPLQKSPAPSAGSLAAPAAKSPQRVSPVPLAELTAVSNLIDTATKQMGGADSFPPAGEPVRPSKESWATFDSPKPKFQLTPAEMGEGRRQRCGLGKIAAHLGPPAPPSNASQNDTAESPCSSDPRDENAWNKPGSVGNGLGGSGGGGGGVGTSSGGGRRWQKKERQQTSSSSRDLSPWDDDASDYPKQPHKRGPPGGGQMPHDLTDRHGYYMRHARRMNSCDEDYDYDEGFSQRQRKFKQGISRSRDNFDIESPKWYGHGPPHHTWSPQEMEQSVSSMRARSFERSAYERATYGPPIYDKRGLPLPSSVLPPGSGSSYDRRSGYEGKRSKYYTRPKYEFDEYGDGPVGMSERYRDTSASFEKMPGGKSAGGRRSDYENIYGEGSYKSRGGGGGGDYMYEPPPLPQQRDRKSFDRESVESFESASRRRRSFGSGEVYGSLESREDFRDRYMGVAGGGGEKTRSLQRKSMKLRATGDIDYEQDSENEFHQQPPPLPPQQPPRGSAMRSIDTRSLQRPSQLSSAMSVGGGTSSSLSQMRMRKSSGSSPWDGEEPPLPGQKPWKRPGSSAESERRRAVSLGMSQTPSGSDGEKDRRFRKKQRPRTKDSSGGRYPSAPAHTRDNYEYIAYGDDDDDDDDDDYVDEEYDEPPTDEDKFERLNRRRHEMHQRMLESERRQQHSLCGGPKSMMQRPGSSSGPPYKVAPPPPSAVSLASAAAAKKYHGPPTASSCPAPPVDDYEFDEYEQTPTPTPRSNASASLASSTHPGASKFSFDGGFESDFNQHSPPPPPAGTASSCNSTPAASISAAAGGVGGGATSGTTPATKASFRFSNDFSDREKLHAFGQPSTSVSSLQQFDMDSVAVAATATTNNTPAVGATSPATSLAQATPPPVVVQKLRFDDNVKVSQFDDAAAFEDDFSAAKFDFKEDHQWPAATDTAAPSSKKQSMRNSKLQQRQELIKKSESINIFAKKAEDPFEDDEFFSSAPASACRGGGGVDPERSANDMAGLETLNGGGSPLDAVPPPGQQQQPQPHEFQWDDDDHNFAKFDENM